MGLIAHVPEAGVAQGGAKARIIVYDHRLDQRFADWLFEYPTHSCYPHGFSRTTFF